MNFTQHLLTIAIVGVAATGASAQTTVEWSSLGNTVDQNGKACYVQRFVIGGDLDFDKLCFNQFARGMHTSNIADTLTEIVPGYYSLSSPRIAAARAAGADTVIIDIVTRGSLRNICYSPDGVHTVLRDGSTSATKYSRASIIARPELWRTPGGRDLMPYGDTIYKRNAELNIDNEVSDVYATIPSLKKVTLKDGQVSWNPAMIKTRVINHENPEYYRVTIDPRDGITVEASEKYLPVAVKRVKRIAQGHRYLPAAEIEDWPDFEYRGMMIDIARNYQTPAEMHRVLELLAQYGFNVLHFHFSDDEAWRLEMPSLPELVEVGSRRGYTIDEADHLVQIFAGDGNPATTTGTANGYFTREDFICLLRHADKLGITVLPEIEAPGHARAAIKAMEKRCRVTGDDSWRLIDPADTSKFTSAQAFHDNTLNPAMPGVMRFMRMVAEDIIDMYKEAGVTLPAIHIGGDEVPSGSWIGSPIAREYMAKHGITKAHDLHADFVRRTAALYDSLGYKIGGWQEIALGHSDEYNREVAPRVYCVNSWKPSVAKSGRSVPGRVVDAGFPVLLSNVDHFYIDMAYNYHPDERGLTWGGVVDEFSTLNGYPDKMCPVDDSTPGRILGLQGQLWAETIRSADGLETLLLPKILGLAERAWNGKPTYTDAQFNTLIYARELPNWQRHGYAYHVRMPGIIVTDGKVSMNTACGTEAVIRYTLDGSEPTAQSPVYTAPFATDAKEIRAKTYLGGRNSVTSILYVNN